MTVRRSDWVARLMSTIQEYDRQPFDYNANHCGMFGARCVDAITGSTWAIDMPSGIRDAIEFLKREGDIEEAVTRRLGKPIPGHAARRGDVCLVDGEDGLALGICFGPVILLPGDDGLMRLPLNRAHKHWRVG